MSEALSPIDAAYAAARWGWYLAAFLLVGAGSYAPFLFRGRAGLQADYPATAAELSRRAARLGFGAALALLLLALLRIYLQARTLLDPGEPVTREFLGAVLGSRWGSGWKRQAFLALLAAAAFALTRKGHSLGWLSAAVASVGPSLTTGLTGHANTAASGTGGALLDAGHVLAGGLWLGGLGVMFWAGLGACRSLQPQERPAALRAMVADFSQRAKLLAPLTIVMGTWLAARYLGWTWPLRLFESRYALVLGSKIAVLAVVAALGGYNWRVTQPGLAREGGESRLRRFSALELGFGVILLGITAVLVVLPLPEGGM